MTQTVSSEQPPTSSANPLRAAFAAGYAIHGSTASQRTLGVIQDLLGFSTENVGTAGLYALLETEGIRAGIRDMLFMRRDRMWLRFDHRARSFAARLSHHLDASAIVDNALTAYHNVGEATSHKTQQHQAITAAALLLLSATVREYSDLSANARSLAAAAEAEGTAEGTVSASALLNELAGRPIPDLDALKRLTLQKLNRLQSYWSQADSIMSVQIAGLAGDLGPALSKMIADGASREQLEAATTEIIGQGDGAAFYLDHAIQTAYSQAQLALYRQQQIAQVSWVTAGDDKVCAACDDLEVGSPYNVQDAPVPPDHGGCRCILEPA